MLTNDKTLFYKGELLLFIFFIVLFMYVLPALIEKSLISNQTVMTLTVHLTSSTLILKDPRNNGFDISDFLPRGELPSLPSSIKAVIYITNPMIQG